MYVRIFGLVGAIGACVLAYKISRSPLIGLLAMLGVIAAGMFNHNRKGTITVLALVAALATTAPQTASANGGPSPRWYRLAVPASCKVQGPADPVYAAWQIDPLYKSCLSNAGPDWMTRCAEGAAIYPAGNLVSAAVTSGRSWAMYASRLAELNPWGLLAVSTFGCTIVLLRAG